MTEEQRRALFALREALRLCEGAGIELAGEGLGDCGVSILAIPRPGRSDLIAYPVTAAAIDEVIAAHPDTAAERYLGDATQEAAHGGTISWRFRVPGLRILRWVGAGTRGWWNTEAKRRETQLLAVSGRTFRLDFATSQVYEVLG